MMDAEVIVGLIAGMLGVGFALLVAIGMPLGLFNRLLAVRPAPERIPATRQSLIESILALNDDRQPWSYALTPDDPRADLIAEWKVADARWWGAFARNAFRRSYRAFVTLDERRRELRIVEESGSVRWTAGAGGAVPTVGWEGRFFRGVILFERSREKAYGLKDLFPLRAGELYGYDFDPWRVKGPLLKLAVEHGWSYCPVVLKSHLGRKPTAPSLPSSLRG